MAKKIAFKSTIDGKEFSIPEKFYISLERAVEFLDSFDISEIILFGSCAKSCPRPRSDVDLLILFLDETQIDGRKIREARSELFSYTPPVELHFMSKEYFDNSRDYFAKKIRKEGVVIWQKHTKSSLTKIITSL